jgi:hypothetical protein
MLLSYGNSDDALANVDPAPFLAPLEGSPPSSEVATLSTWLALLCRGAKRRFVYFRIAAINLQFLYSGSFF